MFLSFFLAWFHLSSQVNLIWCHSAPLLYPFLIHVNFKTLTHYFHHRLPAFIFLSLTRFIALCGFFLSYFAVFEISGEGHLNRHFYCYYSKSRNTNSKLLQGMVVCLQQKLDRQGSSSQCSPDYYARKFTSTRSFHFPFKVIIMKLTSSHFQKSWLNYSLLFTA